MTRPNRFYTDPAAPAETKEQQNIARADLEEASIPFVEIHVTHDPMHGEPTPRLAVPAIGVELFGLLDIQHYIKSAQGRPTITSD